MIVSYQKFPEGLVFGLSPEGRNETPWWCCIDFLRPCDIDLCFTAKDLLAIHNEIELCNESVWIVPGTILPEDC